jgi:hypothetical protein
MSKLDAEPEIIDIALVLKLDARKGAAAESLEYCRAKIETRVEHASGANSLEDVEQIVCKELHLVLEEIWTDDDLVATIRNTLLTDSATTRAACSM